MTVCSPYPRLRQGGKSIVVCIEDHQYSPRNFWNGRWRSQWTVNINGSKAEVLGMLKVQVSLYSNSFGHQTKCLVKGFLSH